MNRKPGLIITYVGATSTCLMRPMRPMRLMRPMPSLAFCSTPLAVVLGELRQIRRTQEIHTAFHGMWLSLDRERMRKESVGFRKKVC